MIVTVTLNPAVDEEYVVPNFRPGGWFRSKSVMREAGGRGINVSVMLAQLGYESVAMGFLAGFNGEYIREELRKKHITTNFVHLKGETRTNVYMIDEVGHLETGITEAGPEIDSSSVERFMRNYDRILNQATIIVIGGSIPPGVPNTIYGELVKRARNKGIMTILDAAGDAFVHGLKESPNMAKLDHRFMSDFTGIPLTSLDNTIDVVKKVHEYGVDLSAVSYRIYGDVFNTPKGVYLAEQSDTRDVVSLFGGGEAIITGLLVATLERMDIEKAIRFSMSCAWEDSKHLERGLRGRKEVDSLMSSVRLEKLE